MTKAYKKVEIIWSDEVFHMHVRILNSVQQKAERIRWLSYKNIQIQQA